MTKFIYNINAPGTLTLKNTIVAGNQVPLGSTDIDLWEYDNTQISGSYNLIGAYDGSSFTDGVNGNQVGPTASPISPRLGPLADNGGPTKTCALKAGSPALDMGSTPCTDASGLPVTADQRGFTRPQLDGADIGAYEAQTKPVSGSAGTLLLLLNQ